MEEVFINIEVSITYKSTKLVVLLLKIYRSGIVFLRKQRKANEQELCSPIFGKMGSILEKFDQAGYKRSLSETIDILIPVYNGFEF
jgi:hypothetical protein